MTNQTKPLLISLYSPETDPFVIERELEIDNIMKEQENIFSRLKASCIDFKYYRLLPLSQKLKLPLLSEETRQHLSWKLEELSRLRLCISKEIHDHVKERFNDRH